MRNQEFEFKTVPINRYRKQHIESFKSVGTVSSDWKICKIIKLHSDIIPDFEPPNYNEVKPYYNKLVQEKGQEVTDAYVRKLAADGFVLCQLCGCPRVKYPWPIKCDSKKLLMFVGSECVDNFLDPENKTTKQIKVFKENELRQVFKKWLYNGINQCFAYRKYGNKGPIEYEYWKFQKKLKSMEEDIDYYSPTKIKNTFKKARNLGLTIPHTIKLLFGSINDFA